MGSLWHLHSWAQKKFPFHGLSKYRPSINGVLHSLRPALITQPGQQHVSTNQDADRYACERLQSVTRTKTRCLTAGRRKVHLGLVFFTFTSMARNFLSAANLTTGKTCLWISHLISSKAKINCPFISYSSQESARTSVTCLESSACKPSISIEYEIKRVRYLLATLARASKNDYPPQGRMMT